MQRYILIASQVSRDIKLNYINNSFACTLLSKKRPNRTFKDLVRSVIKQTQIFFLKHPFPNILKQNTKEIACWTPDFEIRILRK